MKFLKEIYADLIEKNESFSGCSETEVAEIQKKLQIEFPESYLEYLKIMGKEAFSFRGENLFFKDIENNQLYSKRLLIENNVDFSLSKNDLVFWMSQGVVFAYFSLDESSNPPVYTYVEGINQKRKEQICGSFSEFMTILYKKEIDPFLPLFEKYDNPFL